jgi:hypothetical protein
LIIVVLFGACQAGLKSISQTTAATVASLSIQLAIDEIEDKMNTFNGMATFSLLATTYGGA